MALNNTNIPSAASDVVAVYTSSYQQVFSTARPIKASVQQDSKPMEHPVETGAVITDNRIILPIEIELSMVLPQGAYRPVYNQILQLFTAGTLLNVQTRTATYLNMLIQRIPHEETADMFDAIPLVIRLKEVQFISTQSQALPAVSVKNPVNQSTVNTGAQQPGTAFPVPPPVVNGTGAPIPQIPAPASNATLNVPRLPGASPITSNQYVDLMNSAGYLNAKSSLPPP